VAYVSWTEHPIYFLDFEGNQASGILEYGVVTLRGSVITEARTRFCAPIGGVRMEDTAVHGLRAEELTGAAPFSDDWEYFAGLRELGPFAAHYAGTENALLKSVWPYPRRSPDFVRAGERTVDWGPWIDSARIYAQLYPQIASGQLEAVVGACGIQSELDGLATRHCPPTRSRYHAALYDALAGAVLLAALAREPQCARLSLGQLLALSTLDPVKREAMSQGELFQ
jgi:DNA polymerase III epsilon subunit-like protein